MRNHENIESSESTALRLDRLSAYLVAEAVGHDEGRMSHGAAQVDQTSLGQQDDVLAVVQRVSVHLSRRIATIVQDFLYLFFKYNSI